MKEKVLIIGAGPAGITAGYEILKRSSAFEVCILEESEAIGGISRTVRHNGNRMDIGGHRFFSKEERVNRWWEEILPTQGAPAMDDKKLGREGTLCEGGPDPEKIDEVMLRRRRISRIYYRRKFFDYPIKMNRKTLKNLGFATTVSAGVSYLKATVCKKKEASLEDFYINRFGQKLYSMFFESYTEKLWGRHPREISADWGVQRVKGLSIRAVLRDILQKRRGDASAENTETSLIEEFAYPKFGPGQLWETAAGRIEAMGGRILKNHRVVGLERADGKITAVRAICDGKELLFPADHVISSMPLKDLVEGLDEVPEDIRRIAEGLPYRDFVTVGVLVRRLNLKNDTGIATLGNIVPDCWIYVQDAGVKLGRIQIFNNWSPYLVADPEKTVWIGLEYFCAEGDAFWQLSDEALQRRGVEELIRMGVLAPGEKALDYHVERVKKAYPAYFDTYGEIGRLVEYLNGTENLYCVGRNGQHRYNNMDHSMVTAFVAAEAILSGESNKRALWQVNTEKEYHEEKGS